MSWFKKIWFLWSAGILISATVFLTVSLLDILLSIPASQAADADIAASLTAGNLSVSAPGQVILTAVDLDNLPDTDGQSTGILSGVEVRDHRQNAPGWSLTVTCTNFSDGVSTIGVTNFSVQPETVTPIGNSSLTGVNLGPVHTFTGINDPATLISADNNYGRGRFDLTTNLALVIGVATKPSTYSATLTETIS